MSDLVTITVDGVQIESKKGMTVVDAAKTADIHIPIFCHHPKLEPVGMCRMCLVRVGMPMRDRATGEAMLEEDGSAKMNWGRGLVTGCTIRVADGMVVQSENDDEVAEARANVIEFLLTSHPLDCPICDKGGECPLQNLTMEHGAGESRFSFGEKMHLQKQVPLGELITLDRERCIQCARCTRFQDEIVDDPVIAFHNRGRRLEIVTNSDPGFDSYWSGNTTDICPVGALTSSDFRFGARPWELTPVASVCNHCSVGCNTTMSTRQEAKSGGRTVIKRIMPRQNEQVNETWICDKGRFVHHYADAADRLTTPLVRKNGELVEASWDEALSLVASKLNESAVGLAGDRMSNEDLYQFQKLIGKDRVALGNPRVGGADVVAKVGLASGSNLADLGKGDAILVVASDLHEEAPIYWLRVKSAVSRGAKLVVLNARPTRLDKYAAHAVYYSAGSALSAAMNLSGDAKDTLVNAENLVAFYGAEGLTYVESDELAKIIGNLLISSNHAGRANNGIIPVWPHGNTQGAYDMGIDGERTGGVLELADEGHTMYVMGTDPVGDGMMSGSNGFLIVQELFLTDTAKVADVVLPAQSWAERDGTYTSGERRVQRFYPAIPAVGSSRPDWKILAQLDEQMNENKVPFATSLVFKKGIAADVPQYAGMDYRTIAVVEDQYPKVGGEDLYYGGTSYDNKAGLGQVYPVASESGDVEPFDLPVVDAVQLDGFPLMGIASLYTPNTLVDHTEFVQKRVAVPTVYVNAADAGKLNVESGDTMTISANGQTVDAHVHVNGHAPEGLALVNGLGAFPVVTIG